MAPERCDLIIAGGTILTVDAADTIIEDGAIAISGNRIVDLGSRQAILDRYQAAEHFDASGSIVHPGFIDAHIHVSQYTSRTVLPRMEGTGVTMGNWKVALTPDDEYASAHLAAVDYLRAGYTGFVDPGTIFEPDAVANAAADAGIRVWLTDPYVADLAQQLAEHEPDLVGGGFIDLWPKSLDEAMARLGSQLFRNRQPDGLVHAFIGIYGAGTASKALMAAAIDLARKSGVQFQEHRGYNPPVYRQEEEMLGMSPIRHLAGDGLLSAGTTFTHMNVIHPEDIPILTEAGARIIWCPYAQMRAMGKGGAEPRMVELARAGVPVALATDIPRTVTFDALGMVAMANSAACGTIASPNEILRMRTISAAASVGASAEFGSLEKGKRADIVIRSRNASEHLGLDLMSEVAILGLTEPPALVLVNGAVALRDGRPTKADPEKSRHAARQSAMQLMRRTGLIA